MPLKKPKPRPKEIQYGVCSPSSSEPLHQISASLTRPSKAEEAGMLAQQLGSEMPWADRFVPELAGTPVTGSMSTLSIRDTPSQYGVQEQLTEQDAFDPLTPATSHTPSPSAIASEDNLSRRTTGHDLPPTYDDIMNSPSSIPARSLSHTAANVDANPKPAVRGATDPPRSYTLHETYKSISGTFTFYDYLELTSSVGSINITLDPQPGDTPAVLRIQAQYGSIKVTVSDQYLERMSKTKSIPRAWDVEIVARTGSITTKLPIGRGSTILIDAAVGSIKSTFYAANASINDQVSSLITQSGVGSQKVQIESYQGQLPVTNISAKHHAKSHGSIKVSYPKTWQGMMHVSSGGLGSVKVSGDKMEHVRLGDKEQHSRRGDGELIEVRCDGHGGAKVECS